MEKTLSQNRGILSELILEYLAHRPNGRDVLENILRGWIPAERLRPHWEEVGEALAYLVTHGLVSETVLPGGKKWYRLNPTKKTEIARLAGHLSQVS